MLKTGYNLSKEEIIERYSKLTTRRGLGKDFNQQILKLAGDLNNKKILDVGCGYGELLEEIAKHYNCQMYGVDFVTIRTDEILEKMKERATIKTCDIQEKLAFPNDYFDYIFCIETLEHLKEPDKCLGEIKRLLKKNGRIILSIPNATSYFPFYYLGRLIPTRWLKNKLLPYEHPLVTDQPIDTCYRYKEIINLILSNGLKIEKIKGYRYLRYLQTLPLIRLIYEFLYPAIEMIMAKLKTEKLAYNLIFLCSLDNFA